MATLPVVRGREVQPQGGGQFQSIRINAGAFGGYSAEALVGLGNTITGLGDIAWRKREELQTAEVMDALARASDDLRTQLYDPTNGLYSQEGANAANLDVRGAEIFSNLAAQYTTGMGPRQVTAFNRAWESTRQQTLDSLARYELGQMQTYRAASADAIIDSAVQRAFHGYTQPEEIDAALTAARTAVAANTLGQPPEVTQIAELAATSRVHMAVLTQLLNDDPNAAVAYYQAHGDEIEAADHVRIQPVIGEAIIQAEANRITEQLTGVGAAAGALTTSGIPVNENVRALAEAAGFADDPAGWAMQHYLEKFDGDVEAALMATVAGEEATQDWLAAGRPDTLGTLMAQNAADPGQFEGDIFEFLGSRGTGLVTEGLDTDFANRLTLAIAAAEAATGERAQINDLFRPAERQAQYYANYTGKPVTWEGVTYYPQRQGGLAAPPGQSRHQSGRAADIQSGAILDWLHQHAGEFGLEFLTGSAFTNDLGHIQLAGGGAANVTTRTGVTATGEPTTMLYADPLAMNVENMYRQAWAISNPQLREIVINQIDDFVGQRNRVISERENAAQEAAWIAVLETGNVSNVPVEVMAQLSPDFVNTLYTAAQRINSPQEPATDYQVYTQFWALTDTQIAELAPAEIFQLRASMDNTDYESAVQHWRTLREAEGDGEAGGMGNQRTRLQIFSDTVAPLRLNDQHLADLNRRFGEFIANEQNRLGTDLNEQQMQTILDRLLLTDATSGGGFGTPLFDQTRVNPETGRLALEGFDAARVYEDIPQQDAINISRVWLDVHGETPAQNDVVDIYNRAIRVWANGGAGYDEFGDTIDGRLFLESFRAEIGRDPTASEIDRAYGQWLLRYIGASSLGPVESTTLEAARAAVDIQDIGVVRQPGETEEDALRRYMRETVPDDPGYFPPPPAPEPEPTPVDELDNVVSGLGVGPAQLPQNDPVITDQRDVVILAGTANRLANILGLPPGGEIMANRLAQRVLTTDLNGGIPEGMLERLEGLPGDVQQAAWDQAATFVRYVARDRNLDDRQIGLLVLHVLADMLFGD